jgi:hypothetical protein
MRALQVADSQEGGKVKLFQGGEVIGCVFDYLGRRRNNWVVGGYTAEVRGRREKGEVARHEREHVENALWEWADLFQVDGTDWQWLDALGEIKMAGERMIGKLPLFPFGGPSYEGMQELYQKAGEVRMGKFDGEMANELLARVAGTPEVTAEELMKEMGSDIGLCFKFYRAVVLYLMEVGLSGRIVEESLRERGVHDRLSETSKALLGRQQEKLKRGLGVYQRLVKLYDGDRVKVEAMLSFVPIRRWGAVERVLKSYGSKAAI